MLLTTTLTTFLIAPPVPVQDDTAAAAPVATEQTATAEGLRSRIKDMRMNLLLGGEQVRRAEREAIDFYGQKSRHVDSRIDDVETELTELRASYDVVLNRALSSRGEEGQAGLREAQPIRAKITELEHEATGLQKRRERLSELIASVEDRDRDRRKLVDQIESASVLPDDLGNPMTGIGLAPPAIAVEPTSPLADDELMRDLLERDERAAKALLFDSDPIGYWDRFPLAPPARSLRNAMRFPLPDPPGQR